MADVALRRPTVSPLGVGLVLLALAVLLVFGKAPQFHGAILDDGRNLILNPHVGSLGTADLRWAAVPHPDYVPRYIPLGWLMADGETRLLGFDPGRLRSVNLLLQLANTLLLAGLLARILRRSGVDGKWTIALAATLGAAAYGLHPLRAEMVGWASTLFWQGAVFWLLLAGYARTSSKPRPVLEALAYAASLLSYPAALGLAPGLFAFDAVKSGWKPALRRNAWVLAVALFVGIGTYHLASVGSPDANLGPFPLASRLTQALAVEGRGLGLWLLPTHLSPYAKPLERILKIPSVESVGAFVLLATFIVSLFLRSARPLLGWTLLFVAAIAPFTWATSWQDPDIPDRYFVISSLVLSVGLALLVAKKPAVMGLLATAAILVWATLAHRELPHWADETALFTHCQNELDRKQPDYLRHWAFFEFHLAIESYNAGDYVLAKRQIDQTLRNDPDTAQYLSASRAIQARADEASSMSPAARAALPSVPVIQHQLLASDALKAQQFSKADAHLAEIRRLNPAYYAAIMARLHAARP